MKGGSFLRFLLNAVRKGMFLLGFITGFSIIDLTELMCWVFGSESIFQVHTIGV